MMRREHSLVGLIRGAASDNWRRAGRLVGAARPRPGGLSLCSPSAVEGDHGRRFALRGRWQHETNHVRRRPARSCGWSARGLQTPHVWATALNRCEPRGTAGQYSLARRVPELTVLSMCVDDREYMISVSSILLTRRPRTLIRHPGVSCMSCHCRYGTTSLGRELRPRALRQGAG